MNADSTDIDALQTRILILEQALRNSSANVPGIQERHWQALINNTDDIILVLDAADCLQSINRSLDILPLRLEIGLPVYAYLPEEPARQLQRTIRRVRETGQPQFFEQVLNASEGGTRWYDTKVIGFAADGTQGTSGGAILIVTDITARKRIEANLEQAMTAAQSANLAKNMFLAVMSHEIRTPLNGVMGMLQLLKLTPLKDEQRDMVEIAHHSSEGLLALLTDLLDFSKIEAGRMELERERFELRQLVEEVVALHAPSGRKKNLVLNCRFEHRVSDKRNGDITRLQQILNNLLSNAIKFTDKGEVTVRVSQGHQPDEVCFEVSDSGIGIAPELSESIFEPFTQVDGTIRRKHGGTGLGLPICRRLVRAMGGELTFESQPGSGTRFQFSLILSQPLTANTEAPPEQAVLPDDVRVLVVEDNLVNQMVAVKMLEKLGVAADVAVDGEQGLAALAAKKYDLVLMDMMMPVLDGIDATRRLRASERDGEHQTVIAMTANVSEGDRETCFAAGMDDFLPKPIALDSLQAVLARWLVKAPETSPEQNNPAESQPETDVLDRRVLGELRELMPEHFAEMLQTFYSDTEQGLKALREAAQRGYRELLVRTAHMLKGSSGNFGAVTFTRLCAELQAHGSSLAPADALSRVDSLSRVDELEAAYHKLKAALEAEL